MYAAPLSPSRISPAWSLRARRSQLKALPRDPVGVIPQSGSFHGQRCETRQQDGEFQLVAINFSQLQ